MSKEELNKKAAEKAKETEDKLKDEKGKQIYSDTINIVPEKILITFYFSYYIFH